MAANLRRNNDDKRRQTTTDDDRRPKPCKHSSNPQTPNYKREPFTTHSGKLIKIQLFLALDLVLQLFGTLKKYPSMPNKNCIGVKKNNNNKCNISHSPHITQPSFPNHQFCQNYEISVNQNYQIVVRVIQKKHHVLQAVKKPCFA